MECKQTKIAVGYHVTCENKSRNGEAREDSFESMNRCREYLIIIDFNDLDIFLWCWDCLVIGLFIISFVYGRP